MKKIWKRLICLVLLAALCLGEAPAFADQTGTLKITVGDSESKFDRKGIKIEIYRISTNVVAENWSLLPAFSGVKIPSSKEESNQAEKTDAANAAIRQAILAHSVSPVDTRETDENGQIDFTGLEAGVYYGRASEVPAYLTVQDFLVSVPQKDDNDQWKYSAEANLKVRYQPPTPTTSEPPEEPTPSPSPSPTPTLIPPPKKVETPTPETSTAAPTMTPRPTPGPTPGPHKLIIHYIYADTGETAAPDYNDVLWEGEEYDVWSPIIPNYWYDIPEVVGVMPDHDMEYTVLYFTKKTGWRYITLEDYETALGIGMIQMHVGVCYE